MLRSKGRLYFAFVCSVMHCASETWSVKKDNRIILDRNDARIIRWIAVLEE